MELIKSISTNHPNYSFSFFGDDKLILHSNCGTVYIQSALPEDSKEAISFFDEKPQTSGTKEISVAILAVSSTQVYFASSNEDGIIRIWDVKNKELVSRFKVDDSSIWSLKFTDKDKSIIVGCNNGSIYKYALDGKLKKQVIKADCNSVYGLDIHPINSDIIAYSKKDNYVELTNLNKKEKKKKILQYKPGKFAGFIGVVKFFPDGSKIVSGDHYGSLAVWDSKTGELLNFIDLHEGRFYYSSINAIAFHGDNIFVARYRDIFKFFANSINQEPVRVAGMENEIFDIAISPDGCLIAFGGSEHKIDVYSLTE